MALITSWHVIMTASVERIDPLCRDDAEPEESPVAHPQVCEVIRMFTKHHESSVELATIQLAYLESARTVAFPGGQHAAMTVALLGSVQFVNMLGLTGVEVKPLQAASCVTGGRLLMLLQPEKVTTR